jgi:hypothetical protein
MLARMLSHLASALAASVCFGAAPSMPTPAVPSGWQLYVASDAGFQALLPGTPLRQDVPAGPQRLQVFTLKRSDAEFFVNVTIAEQGTSVAGLLDESVRVMTAPRKDATILLNEKRTRQGHPAREFHMKNSGGTVAFLWVERDDRIYQAAVRVLGDASLPHTDVRTFFDSFSIVPIVTRPKPAGTIPLSDWKEYSPRGGRFVARFPSEPTESRDRSEEQSTTTWSIDADQVSYTVALIQFAKKPRLPAGFLTRMIDGSAEKLRTLGTVTKSPEFVVAGLPAQELAVDGRGGHMAVRFVVAKDRVYQLTAIAAGSNRTPPGETRFFTSFRALR